MAELMTDTWEVAKRASPYGIGGTIIGAGFGLSLAYLDGKQGAKEYGKLMALGAGMTGSVTQAIGMLIVNNDYRANHGILVSPITAPLGAAGLAGIDRFVRNKRDTNDFIKSSLMGGFIGGFFGIAIDGFRSQAIKKQRANSSGAISRRPRTAMF
tara:strand:+ start:683 stop:1147 length:465 start_codon:yes stop_codon:yes gene_type:complete